MSREIPVRCQGPPSRLGPTVVEIGCTGGQVEKRELGRLLEDCFYPRNPRAKETRTKHSIRKADLCERLSDSRLSGPRKAIEPEHGAVPFVPQPAFELQKYVRPSSPQAPLPVPRTVSRVGGATDLFQEVVIRISLFAS